MTKQERNTLLIKMTRVIASCNTDAQLKVAMRYSQLTKAKLEREGWFTRHFYLDHVTEARMYATNKIMQAEK